MASKLKSIIRNFKKDCDLLDTCTDKTDAHYYLKRLIEEMAFIMNDYHVPTGHRIHTNSYDDQVLQSTVEKLWESMNKGQRIALLEMSQGV